MARIVLMTGLDRKEIQKITELLEENNDELIVVSNRMSLLMNKVH